MADALGKLVGDDGTELDDGVAAAPLNPASANGETGLVQHQVGRVEEEDLPDLRLERVEPEGGDRPLVRARRERDLQLDAVGPADQAEELSELLARELDEPLLSGCRCGHDAPFGYPNRSTSSP